MKAARSVALTALAAVLIAVPTLAAAPREIVAPPYAGVALPSCARPDWQPPSPAGPFALATQTLARQGFPSPDGGRYRAATVCTGNPWNGGGLEDEVHAWVMPAAGGEQQFAVCWNGLVYPVIKLGADADLNADVAALLSGAKSRRRFKDAKPDSYGASEAYPSPLKVCLLYLDGRPDLAARCGDAFAGDVAWEAGQNGPDKSDPYLALASEWAWNLFDRAVNAHMRGDDRLSEFSAQTLAGARPLIEAEAAKRGYSRPGNSWPGPQYDPVPYLKFCAPLDELLADERRRTAAGQEGVREASATPVFAPGDAGIKAMIASLDLVAAAQNGQPGTIRLKDDILVRALIARGNASVPALLDTLEHDDRLTRSVGFGRDFWRDRHPVPVHRAAFTALCAILGTSEFGQPRDACLYNDDPKSRPLLASAIRAYWSRYRGLSEPQRWRRMLSDDTEAQERWFDAASRIVQRSSETLDMTSSNFVSRLSPPSAGARSQAMLGESLRDKRRPSVSDLLRKRIQQLQQELPGDSDGAAEMSEKIVPLALMMERWDPDASLSVLRDVAELAEKRSPDRINETSYSPGEIARLTLARIDARDPRAQSDFADWMARLRPSDLPGYDMAAAFEPWWRYPDDPVARDASDRFFNGRMSAFGPAARDKAAQAIVARLIGSELMLLPAFRERVLRGLADNSVAGKLTQSAAGGAEIVLQDGTAVWTGPGVPASRQRLADRPLSTAETYAALLAGCDGMADFLVTGTRSQRREGIERSAAALKRYGGHFHVDVRDYGLFEYFFAVPRLVFQPLGRPATAADVSNGNAIFCLKAPSRMANIHLPAQALWGSMPEIIPNRFDSGYSFGPQKGVYGTIWQAEEVQENGKRMRYYGFVGPGAMVKLPASQLKILPLQ